MAGAGRGIPRRLPCRRCIAAPPCPWGSRGLADRAAADDAVASGTAAVSSVQPPAGSPSSFLGFAWSAHSDVEGVWGSLEGSSWVQRLHRHSDLALELWPTQAPHWRVAAPLVVPGPRGGASPQDLAKDLAVPAPAGAKASGSAAASQPPAASGKQGLDPAARAAVLRALSLLHPSPRTSRKLAALAAALVDGGGVSGSRTGLASQLTLDELHKVLTAVASSTLLQSAASTPLTDFIKQGVARLVKKDDLALSQLLELRSALQRSGLPTDSVDERMRGRLKQRLEAKAEPLSAAEVAAVVTCAQVLGEDSSLRDARLRQALLPERLQVGAAAALLPHALPAEGSPTPAQQLLVAMAAEKVVSQVKQLAVREIGSVLQGVLRLQLCGDGFAVQHAARLLRALWPRITTRLAHLGPEELAAALRCYCWQLQYSRQEAALLGVPRQHPIADLGVEEGVPETSAKGRIRRVQAATDALKAQLIRPTFSRLGEMPLRHATACLTAVAPAVSPPDVLSEPADRAALKEAVDAAFPVDEQGRSGGMRWADFREDHLAGELQSMEMAELLELACGLKEANAAAQWPVDAVLLELEQRLRAARRIRPSVELSHFLLLRMCRVMSLWHNHAVEEVLTNLLSDPDAMKPLPTPYFVTVLSALCSFLVPREVPLRLAASFLDHADAGERAVRPEQWVDVLAAIRPVEEPPSFERVTPRIVQHLVPNVASLPPPAVATLLQTLSTKGPMAEFGSASELRGGPLDRLPAAASEAVRATLQAGAWDLSEVVRAFDALGRLGWYAEATVAAVLLHCQQTPLLEPHVPLLLPLARACSSLRVHHAPLLHKMVQWYCWCYSYLKPKPLPADQVDELLEFADLLLELSFQSMEMQGIMAANLRNPNASPKQVLALLAGLARFSHFPPEFKEACARVCAESSDSDLASLSTPDLVNAFNIHLCAVFDGPAALKHWLTEDAAMKAFFQVHTSQKWYQKQDQERVAFLQSDAYLTLRDAVKAEGLQLRPSDPGEVYHVELVSTDAKERLGAMSNNPPIALVCIKSREQLRWYVPITAEASTEAIAPSRNRCLQFRYMFRGSVQKMRHLQAMGYRTAAIWLSEWNALETLEQRRAALRVALGTPDRRSTAFSPVAAEDEEAYR